MTRPTDDPLLDDDVDEPLPLAVEREHALVGAALVDPVAADLVLAETNPDDFTSPLAERAFLVLLWWSELDPIRFATEAGADLVREELGDQDVDYLIADRPALRHARAALRAAATGIGRVQDEPLVQLAAVELEAELAFTTSQQPSPNPNEA